MRQQQICPAPQSLAFRCKAVTNTTQLMKACCAPLLLQVLSTSLPAVLQCYSITHSHHVLCHIQLPKILRWDIFGKPADMTTFAPQLPWILQSVVYIMQETAYPALHSVIATRTINECECWMNTVHEQLWMRNIRMHFTHTIVPGRAQPQNPILAATSHLVMCDVYLLCVCSLSTSASWA